MAWSPHGTGDVSQFASLLQPCPTTSRPRDIPDGNIRRHHADSTFQNFFNQIASRAHSGHFTGSSQVGSLLQLLWSQSVGASYGETVFTNRSPASCSSQRCFSCRNWWAFQKVCERKHPLISSTVKSDLQETAPKLRKRDYGMSPHR